MSRHYRDWKIDWVDLTLGLLGIYLIVVVSYEHVSHATVQEHVEREADEYYIDHLETVLLSVIAERGTEKSVPLDEGIEGKSERYQNGEVSFNLRKVRENIEQKRRERKRD